MDIFFEKNLVNNSIDKHSKRSKVFHVLKIVSVVLLIISIFIIFTFYPIPKSAAQILPFILAIVSTLSPSIVMIIVFSKLLNNTNIEYDYFINGNIFRIVQVQRRSKRKLFLETSLTNIDSIGCVDSETFNRYSSNKEVKNIFAICNDEIDDLIYMYLTYKGLKTLLILEGDSEFIMNLRKAIGRFNVFDNSLKKITDKPVTENKERL